MAKCKICNVELELDDALDAYLEDPKVIVKEDGHCPKCGKNYIWFDYFEYKSSSEPKEYD